MWPLQEVAGVAAGALSILGSALYIFSIGKGRGKTKPEESTWIIWTLVSILIAISYYQSGARDTMWMPVALALEAGVVALLSFRYGIKWNKKDLVCLVGAVIAALVWWHYNSPLIALCALIVIDAFGVYPTLVKVWRQPRTEARTPWILTVLASLANLFAINWDATTFAIVLYPAYMLIANGLITWPLIKKRTR